MLGAEDVLHENVSHWQQIRNRVQNIVVYACGAGGTEPGTEGTAADGRYLMGALALHTRATVYAADRLQWYRTLHDRARGRFEWGAWEGVLMAFSPDGYSVTPVQRAPVEFADVMAGS